MDAEIFSKEERSEQDLQMELRQWKKKHSRLKKKLEKKNKGDVDTEPVKESHADLGQPSPAANSSGPADKTFAQDVGEVDAPDPQADAGNAFDKDEAGAGGPARLGDDQTQGGAEVEEDSDGDTFGTSTGSDGGLSCSSDASESEESDSDGGHTEARPPRVKLSAGGVYALVSDVVGDVLTEQIHDVLAELGRERSFATAMSRRLILRATASATSQFDRPVPAALVPAYNEMAAKRDVADPSTRHAHSLHAGYRWRNRREAADAVAKENPVMAPDSSDKSDEDEDEDADVEESTVITLSEAREVLPRDGLLRAEYSKHEFGWWLETEMVPLLLRGTGDLSAFAISPDGRMLGAGTLAGGIAVWALQSKEPVLIRYTPSVAGGARITSIAWCSDGSEVITLDEVGTTRVWCLVADTSAMYPVAALKAAEFWGMVAGQAAALAQRGYGGTMGVPPVLVEAMMLRQREWEVEAGKMPTRSEGSGDPELSRTASRHTPGKDRFSQAFIAKASSEAETHAVASDVDEDKPENAKEDEDDRDAEVGGRTLDTANEDEVGSKTEDGGAKNVASTRTTRGKEESMTAIAAEALEALERARAAKEAAQEAIGGLNVLVGMGVPIWTSPPTGASLGAPSQAHLQMSITHRQFFYPPLNKPEGDELDGVVTGQDRAVGTIAKLRRTEDMARLKHAGPQRTGSGVDLAQLFPLSCAFFPSFTILGSQPCLVVALRGGPCIKINRPGAERTVHSAPLALGRPLAGESGEPVAEPVGGSGARAAAAVRANRGGRKGSVDTLAGPACPTSLIAREYFVGHAVPVLAMGFLKYSGTMVTLAEDGSLFFWPYRKEQRSSNGWLRPGRELTIGMKARQLVVDVSSISYPPHFPPGDLEIPPTPYPMWYKKLLLRYEAKAIAPLNLPAHPWRTLRLDFPENATRYTFYTGPGSVEDISEDGGEFVSITRDEHGNLLRHTTATYKWRVTQGELCAAAFSPSGTELATLLFFEMTDAKVKKKKRHPAESGEGVLNGEGPQLRLQVLNLTTTQWAPGSALIPASASIMSSPLIRWGPCLDLPLADYLYVLVENVVRIFSLGSLTMVRAIRPLGDQLYPPLDMLDIAGDGRHLVVGSSNGKQLVFLYSVIHPNNAVGVHRGNWRSHSAGLMRTRLGSARAHVVPIEQRIRQHEAFALGHESGGFPRTRAHMLRFMQRTVEAIIDRAVDKSEGANSTRQRRKSTDRTSRASSSLSPKQRRSKSRVAHPS